MEKVTILRRGESLDSMMNEKGGLAGIRTGRLRPRPEMVQKTDMYAGSAFVVSPEPSSLPLPSFSRKKQVLKVIDDDSATRDDVPVCLFGSLLISTLLDLESFFGFWFSVIDVLSGE
ncbi:hypothetical protein ACFX1W_028822 [Malus domestica]